MFFIQHCFICRPSDSTHGVGGRSHPQNMIQLLYGRLCISAVRSEWVHYVKYVLLTFSQNVRTRPSLSTWNFRTICGARNRVGIGLSYQPAKHAFGFWRQLRATSYCSWLAFKPDDGIRLSDSSHLCIVNYRQQNWIDPVC